MRINVKAASIIVALIIALAACPRLTPKHGIRLDNRDADMEAYIASELDPGRDEWQKPGEVIEALWIEGGETVADVGAGAGYFTWRLAEAVGPGGTVYAAENQPDLLELLAKHSTEAGLANVTIIKALSHDPHLPFESVELALVCNNMSRIDLAYTFYEHIRQGLKTKGRLVIIDWKKEAKIGPDRELRRSRKEVLAIVHGLGFKLVKEYDFLSYQYFLVFVLEERYG